MLSLHIHSLPFDSIFPSSVPADCVSNYKYEQENVLEWPLMSPLSLTVQFNLM